MTVFISVVSTIINNIQTSHSQYVCWPLSSGLVLQAQGGPGNKEKLLQRDKTLTNLINCLLHNNFMQKQYILHFIA